MSTPVNDTLQNIGGHLIIVKCVAGPGGRPERPVRFGLLSGLLLERPSSAQPLAAKCRFRIWNVAGRQDSNPRPFGRLRQALRFWRRVVVSAMPAYLTAQALCAKAAAVPAGILARRSSAGSRRFEGAGACDSRRGQTDSLGAFAVAPAAAVMVWPPVTTGPPETRLEPALPGCSDGRHCRAVTYVTRR